jgi:hypothetical protein
MPPQKNSGNKKSKKESGVVLKNQTFIRNILDDVRVDGKVDSVHIARVIRKMGNGRMEVFYIVKPDNKDPRGVVAQAVIPGRFRGRGRHAVWIDVGSIVAVADIGIPGSASLEIVAIYTSDDIRDLKNQMDIDPRVLAIDNTNADTLMCANALDEGFTIEDELNIDDI